MEDPRIDRLLWALRLYKSRPEATAACREGRVTIGRTAAKPGRKVHVGEVLEIRTAELTRTIRLLAFPRSRVGAKLLPEFMADLTPPGEYERARQAATERALARQRAGSGRPTKKDRRDLSKFFGFDP